MAMKPVLERMMSPSANEESCHIMGSKEIFPLKVRQNDLVPLRYLRTRLACAQLIYHGTGHVSNEVVDNNNDVRVGAVRAV